jgi:hypothetical protein
MASPQRRPTRHDSYDEPFDPEVTEGGVPHSDSPPSLQEFLAETFGEDAPAPPPAGATAGELQPSEGDGTGLPSLGWIKANYKTKSAAIRFLVSRTDDNGNPLHKVADIANLLGVKYQHVRNVKVTPLKRGPNEPWDPKVRAAQEEAKRKLAEGAKK